MNIKITMFSAVVLSCVALFAHDYQIVSNGIGDSALITLGGYTFAKPVSIDLKLTNMPVDGEECTVRFQVIYLDNSMPRPKTRTELRFVRIVGKFLNEWLKDFIESEYQDVEYERMLRAYLSGEFVDDINNRFPEYVVDMINRMNPDEQFNLDTVTVLAEAEGTFRADLIKLRSEQEQ